MKEDFDIVTHFLIVHNETSGTNVLDYRKVMFLEVQPASCIFTMPKGGCTTGHMLTLYISEDKKAVTLKHSPSGKGIPGAIAITGKVVKTAEINARFIAVHLNFTQFVAQEWSQIQQIYEKRTQGKDIS
ncbi:MAG: hypothetical protein ACOCUT_03475 [bacterium]